MRSASTALLALAVFTVSCRSEDTRFDPPDAAPDSHVGAPDAAAPPPAMIVVNEVAAAGDPDDWVELYNAGTDAVDLSSYYLTDDIAGAPAAAQFEAGTTIASGQYLQITLTNSGFPGFQLGKDEEFAVVAPDGTTIVDQVDWNAGDSPSGGSYARIPDVVGPFQTIVPATPGAANEP